MGTDAEFLQQLCFNVALVAKTMLAIDSCLFYLAPVRPQPYNVAYFTDQSFLSVEASNVYFPALNTSVRCWVDGSMMTYHQGG